MTPYRKQQGGEDSDIVHFAFMGRDSVTGLVAEIPELHLSATGSQQARAKREKSLEMIVVKTGHIHAGLKGGPFPAISADLHFADILPVGNPQEKVVADRIGMGVRF